MICAAPERLLTGGPLMNSHHPVIIIGGGPAGLSCAVALRHRGVASLILDQHPNVGASWARRYDNLQLHTVRQFSGLPHHPIPSHYPQYLSRDQLAQYYRDCAAHWRLDIRSNCRVVEIAHDEGSAGFVVRTDRAEWRCETVVIATGQYNIPRSPHWPGRKEFRGELLHSCDYSTPGAYAGKRVLVVGMGNSGSDIAADLAAAGVAFVAVSVRTPPMLVPRDWLGVPLQAYGMLLTRLPTRIADSIVLRLARIAHGDLRRHGLAAPAWRPFAAKRLPTIDDGFIAALKAGRIAIRPDIARLTPGGVVFDNGDEEAFDAIITATGFRTGLDRFLRIEGLLRSDGSPKFRSGMPTSVPGLYFMGFTDSLRGHLFEANRDSRRLARSI